MKRIGILALQGAFVEHAIILDKLGVETTFIKLAKELNNVDGLVIPGGESTTISKLMEDFDLMGKIKNLISEGIPVFGTCAGAILLARKVSGLNHKPLGAIDIEVKRNAFGHQVESFETDLDISVLGEPLFHAVFIRAPRIEKVGKDVKILAKLPNGALVAAQEKNVLVSAFHPELTSDYRFHAYFLKMSKNLI